MLSVLSLSLGLLLYRFWTGWREHTIVIERLSQFGPEAGYNKLMQGLVSFSTWQTKTLQNGNLRHYLITTLATVVLLVGWAVLRLDKIELNIDFSGVQLQEITVVGLLLITILAAVTAKSFLAAVALIGALGFGVALIYVFFSAVDVGITQVLVETITVLLLVLVLYRLPEFRQLSSRANRARDATIALLSGGLITVLILLVTNANSMDSISSYFLEKSVSEGYGRNVVNVILVDFRALDTLGEIFVLALVAIGVYSMMHLRTGVLPVTNADKRHAVQKQREKSAKTGVKP
jgi:multicomponent Na+:H+ antiporter subunit A